MRLVLRIAAIFTMHFGIISLLVVVFVLFYYPQMLHIYSMYIVQTYVMYGRARRNAAKYS